MNYGFTDIVTLLGALGLFLYGMKIMNDALLEVAGNKLRGILTVMTANRFKAILTGLGITAIIQSSSATTLMVVGFVNAGFLKLRQAIGVIMGANIGTTVTAWLIAILGFKVSMSAIALPLVGLGFLLTFSKQRKNRYWGQFIIGFSLIFIGLQFLKESVPDLKHNPQILEFLSAYTDLGVWSVLIFLLIGLVVTVIIQSSSATMALILVMCNEGWIPFDMAAAMVLGGNIGTTITANLGAIVSGFNAKRAAKAHLIFNVLGVIIMLLIFYPSLNAIGSLVSYNGRPSPFSSPGAIPIALSIFHTAFNIINTLVLVWFVGLIEKIVIKMVPEKTAPEEAIEQPRFIDEQALYYPQTAFKALEDETKRLFERATFEIITHGLNLHRKDITSTAKLEKIIKKSTEDMHTNIDDIYYKKVKTIYSKIIEFTTKLQTKFSLSKEDNEQLQNLKVANRYIVDSIKKITILQKNITRYMTDENENIRKQYNKLRKKISKIEREIYLALTDESGANTHLEKLKKLKLKIQKTDMLTDGTIDNLIRKDKITGEMATSLINDSNLMTEISKNLIITAELLYFNKDTIANNGENGI